MTDEQHNKYIAYAFAAHGAFQLLMGILIGAMFLFFASLDPTDGPPPAFLVFMFAFMFFFQALFAAPSFVATYALLKRKPWARVSGIAAAVISAMSVPIGTGAAVYSLWFFCGENWKSVYSEAAIEGRSRAPLSVGPSSQEQWDDYTREDDAAFVYRTPPPPDWR